MGETRVDLWHLLEDLRDAYPGSAEETILTEIVANSLDSGATTITITTTAAARSLMIVDDGVGMRRRDLARYHDIAASTKVRGAGIGFAGVGIKIGLLVSEEVLTETRRGRHHVATTWRLASRHRAPWRWVPPPGMVVARGTAVRLTVENLLSPLLDAGFVETTLRRQFQPLFDPALAEFLAAPYPRGVRFVLNEAALEPRAWPALETAPVAVRLARKRRPSAFGLIVRERSSLSTDQQGMAISTYGKVIKRGWDWLGITPVTPDRIGGLIEAPALAECLTLNKADFIRSGSRGALYLGYRKAIQEAVTRALAVWGDLREAGEQQRRRAARPVERDLEAVLMDLAQEFPLVAALVEQHRGGQRKLPIGHGAPESEGPGLAGRLVAPIDTTPPAAPGATGRATAEPPEAGIDGEPPPSPSPTVPELAALPVTANGAASSRERRPAKYGLSIQFEQRPEHSELARLVESTVWVNESHPAYRRAVASRSEGYHIALAVAMALATLAVEPAKEHGFVTAFLASWGAAIDRRPTRRRRAR
jgi:hypothetical protein